MPKKILSQLIEQYQTKNQVKPDRIVIAPVALVALGCKRSVMTSWEGIPVECRLFDESEVVMQGPKLGVFVQKDGDTDMAIRACELA
jgi:hypothetical protein